MRKVLLTIKENKKVGIISSDKENVSYYLTEYKDIEIVEYTTFED